ncbi:zeatin O-glucosyltransferase-like [Apium graveolens]|uniref:zeatin O-glucosyltransferase-like n=1 Tax=Apium graveolens TaxID=4045 RepID=UPI003D7A9948
MGVEEIQATENNVVVVVMVPFPAQGHLNQLLHLSRLISSYNIPVHYVATTTHTRQAKLRIQGWDPLSPDSQLIHFHEFPTPDFQSPPPNPNASTKFPAHLQPSFDAALLLREPVAAVISELSLSARRLVVVYDSIFPSVIQDIASIPNGEAYSFHSVSTFCISSYYWDMVGKPVGMDDDIDKHIPHGGILTTMTSEMRELVNSQHEYRKYSSGALFNTCRAIEAPFLDVLAKVNDKQWPIGPFNPVELCKNSKKQGYNHLDWLDNQAPNSVIYVSFGTTTTLTNEQIHAIAVGLENSGQKFIWVLRDADKGDIFVGDTRVCELPEGYEERITLKGQGIILRGWAPQLEILAHVSTGGFMSHCGWNSCMESMSMGVPMATWPMHSDQPHNALLITKVLKVGVVVKDWAHRDELVESLTVKKAVKELMASKEGEGLRRRVVELGTAIRRSVAEGGDTHKEFDGFIAHICR